MKKILIINGSLRKNSFNMQLAKTVEKILKDKAETVFLHYEDVPFFNQDIESPVPDAVERVRQAVLKADGIWIFTPEYNSQIPGVLKNLLDWLSRPLVKGDWQKGSAVKGKPVTICGVAGKSKALGARKNLSSLVQSISMNLIGGEGTGISLSSDDFRTDILSLSKEDTDLLMKQADEFLSEI